MRRGVGVGVEEEGVRRRLRIRELELQSEGDGEGGRIFCWFFLSRPRHPFALFCRGCACRLQLQPATLCPAS